jgi:V/A-type H+-transporting ATPase subunit K
MGKYLVAVLGLVPAILISIYFLRRSKSRPSAAATLRNVLKGLFGFNAVLVLIVVGAAVIWLYFPSHVSAAMGGAPAPQEEEPEMTLAVALATGLSAIGAGLSVGGAAIGAGIAVGGTGAAAVGTIAEKPESLGRALIFVGLAEGIAIYGIIISFMVLNR